MINETEISEQEVLDSILVALKKELKSSAINTELLDTLSRAYQRIKSTNI